MPPHKLLIFSPSQPNPYRELIAQADEIIVTSDSISMVIDAVSAAKPTRVFRLPRHQSVIHRIMEWCQNNVLAYDPRPMWSTPFAWLFDRGFIETTADRAKFFESLIAERRLDWFGEAHSTFTLKPPDDETSGAAEAVRGIFTT